MLKVLTIRYLNDIVSFEQLGPGYTVTFNRYYLSRNVKTVSSNICAQHRLRAIHAFAQYNLSPNCSPEETLYPLLLKESTCAMVHCIFWGCSWYDMFFYWTLLDEIPLKSSMILYDRYSMLSSQCTHYIWFKLRIPRLSIDSNTYWPDIQKKKKKKKKNHKILRETFVIIMDVASRFNLFCVSFFHCCPLFFLLYNQICWCIRRNASRMFDKCSRSTCC